MSCPDCFKGTIHDGTPRGKIEKIHGLETYVATPEGTVAPGAAIIFASDVFGLHLVNNKLLCDKYAADTGCRVLMPATLPGGGASLAVIPAMRAMNEHVPWYNIFGQVGKMAATATAGFHLVPFFIRTRNYLPELLAFMRAVKADLPAGGRLGIAGFCWGGFHSTKIAGEPQVEGGNTPLVEAVFTAHPSGLSLPGDLTAAADKFHVPVTLALGDNDIMVSTKAIPGIEAALDKSFGGDKSKYEVKVYEGCTHGFAVRADPKISIEDKAAIAAADQAARWFRKYLLE